MTDCLSNDSALIWSQLFAELCDVLSSSNSEAIWEAFSSCIAVTAMKSFYVDDCLAGAESEKVAFDLINNLRTLLAMGGFKLTKWLSSSNIVMKRRRELEEENSKIVKSALPSTALLRRVLGVYWNVMTDEFFFTTEMPNYLVTVTKRKILSVTNSLYDPMRFAGPVVLHARLLYTARFDVKSCWDEPINGVYAKRRQL